MTKKQEMVFVFDIGGVLIVWKNNDPIFRYISKKYDVNFQGIKVALLENFVRLESGDISATQWISSALAKLGKKMNKADSANQLLLNQFASRAKVRKGTLRIIQSLRRKGFKVYALTNTSLPHLKYMKKVGWVGYFDGFYSSCELGGVKPDPALYKMVLNEIEVKPHQVVFIDDRRENVAGAKSLGIEHSIRFTTVQKLNNKIKDIVGNI